MLCWVCPFLLGQLPALLAGGCINSRQAGQGLGSSRSAPACLCHIPTDLPPRPAYPRLPACLPAGISSLWMALGWNYYVGMAGRAEPAMSEDITVTQKDD